MVGHAALDDDGLQLVRQNTVAAGFAQRQGKAVGEHQFFGADGFHHVAVQKVQPGFLAKVVFFVQCNGPGFARGVLQRHVGGAVGGGAADAGQAQGLHAAGVCAHGIDRDAFDQPLPERGKTVQRVQQVAIAVVFEGGPEADGQQRVEAGEVFLGLLALEAVWLVDDKHGPDGGQCLHVAFGVAKQVGFYAALVDGVLVAVERLERGHQHRNAPVGRVDEARHGFVGIVDDVDVLVVVFLGKKRGGGL